VGKLWLSQVTANQEQPVTQLLDAHEDVHGVAVLALKDVVYVVYARGDDTTGNIWIVKSLGDQQWSTPVQLTAAPLPDGQEQAYLDREPCITQFNDEIWIAFSRSQNGKASVIEYLKLDAAVFEEAQ